MIQRSQPPEIDGYIHKHWLGGGGFADVFLYEQRMPSREVAVKVLMSNALDAEGREEFEAEANLMARVSHHPYIVAIYGAGASRDGRPYLVMEYYSESHYGSRVEAGGVRVDDVLRLGVQIASAVEVAHRAGVIHRDIKPSNILVNHYGNPGLADFGIAGARTSESMAVSRGYSVAFTAPEVIAEESPGDERSDIYSLAATLYTLLAGRSPFWSPEGDNSVDKMVRRILDEPIPPTGREDIPPSLDHFLVHAMRKDPASRPTSAVVFARTLQAIERDLRLGPTPIEVPQATTLGATAADTFVRPGGSASSDNSASLAEAVETKEESEPNKRLVVAHDTANRTDHPATSPTSRGSKPHLRIALVATIALIVTASMGGAITLLLDRSSNIANDTVNRRRINASRPLPTTTPSTAQPSPSLLQAGGLPPWAGPLITSGSDRDVGLTEWRGSKPGSDGHLLLPVDTGLSSPEVRRADFGDGQWAVVWDDVGTKGVFPSGGYCDSCGRGTAGIASERVDNSTGETPPTARPGGFSGGAIHVQWSDGSELHYEQFDAVRDYDNKNQTFENVPGVEWRATIHVAGDRDLIVLWTYTGREHLEYLIGQLRFVSGAP